ncbi:hypothetical protein [Micromonospora sp. DT233]|uniref:hypothetical protein n=1 Tax=Micromonospora sp. DT233 TaxID=3393432 RepID=UPI003CEB9F8A
MIKDRRRPSRLSGFRACLLGGAVLLALLALLRPITRFEDCPNYGGNGNASAFENPAWDLYLTALLFGWALLVVVEQALPVTRRGRGSVDVALRAAGAITLTTIASCSLFVNVTLLCH